MKLAQQKDDAILAIVEPMMDNLMQASAEIDHARHVADFSDRLKEIVTAEHLEKVCKRYQARWGLPDRRETIAVFRRASSVAVVWKQWLTQTDDEFVAELVLVEEDNRYLIDHVVFF